MLDGLEQEQSYLQSRFKDQLAIVSELGPGSGIVTTFLMQNCIPNVTGSMYLAIDISPWALDATMDAQIRNDCQGRYLSVIQSDLTKCLRKNTIDLLVFNPPYVPAEEVPQRPSNEDDRGHWLELALLGGQDGMVITQQVLDQLDTILSPKGVAYILFCARNKPELVSHRMTRQGWDVELVINRKAGWEVLSIYRFTRQL